MRRAGLAQRCAVLGLAASLSGCVSTGRLPPVDAAAPALDPVAFFSGSSHGEGQLKIALRRTRQVVVDSQGQGDGAGGIRLDQTVQMPGQAATQRQWQLRPQGAGRFSGQLSDAAGPVTGTASGNRLHLRFAMKGGLRADQWLALQPGGQVVRNVMIVRKWGLPLARLDETITRREK